MAAIEDAMKAQMEQPNAARLLAKRHSRRKLFSPHTSLAALEQHHTIGGDSGRGHPKTPAFAPEAANVNKNPGAACNR